MTDGSVLLLKFPRTCKENKSFKITHFVLKNNLHIFKSFLKAFLCFCNSVLHFLNVCLTYLLHWIVVTMTYNGGLWHCFIILNKSEDD